MPWFLCSAGMFVPSVCIVYLLSFLVLFSDLLVFFCLFAVSWSLLPSHFFSLALPVFSSSSSSRSFASASGSEPENETLGAR